ncbi:MULTISPECIES: sirohydrochlorin chelatase [Thermomonosporaceae]|uniref:sirohydrochlorin chelatase n=1 Tax=Thermomonosporaceae TaxID=2012 RepID=UPI00255B1CA0|nr:MULTISPECIES: hypothetical protein [Thermomonosporaceae]MDL4775852.1 hypothetical protein [Actinomadura xylanilytica]
MTARRVVLVGGHETLAAGGEGGAGGPDGTADGPIPDVIGTGRELYAAAALPGPLAVVPMTLGRDPGLAAHAAQTLGRLAGHRAPGELLLTRPLGTPTHLVGWLRAAAGRTPEGHAALITAPASSPEQDAELFRIARLVRQYSALRWAEVALSGGDPDVPEAVDRCRRLGAHGVTVVPASFVGRRALGLDTSARGRAPAVRYGGPLLAPAALRRLVAERVAVAERHWDLGGGDGLAAAGTAHHHDHDHVH